MRILSLNIENRMKALGWYQIAGGVYGLFSLILGMFNNEPLTGSTFILYALIIIMFSFSVYCGNLLRKANTKGLSLSNWNQAFQVLQIGVWAIGFAYFSGIRLAIGFDWGEFFLPDVTLSLSGANLRYTLSNTSHLEIWINFIPILIMYWIGKIQNEIEDRKILIESATTIE